jgi:NitT/TauT family transport system ATP-binding protein
VGDGLILLGIATLLYAGVRLAELLGFFTLKDGALFLTPLGQAYASASILARKELIASRIYAC